MVNEKTFVRGAQYRIKVKDNERGDPTMPSEYRVLCTEITEHPDFKGSWWVCFDALEWCNTVSPYLDMARFKYQGVECLDFFWCISDCGNPEHLNKWWDEDHIYEITEAQML